MFRFPSQPELQSLEDPSKTPVSEEDVFQVLESAGFSNTWTDRIDCRVDMSHFSRGVPGASKEFADWLRISVDTCRKANKQELGHLRRLCVPGTDEILQPRTVFLVACPMGFEHDARAQPSTRDWWPNGNHRTFHNFGLERWLAIRDAWDRVPSAGAEGSEGMHTAVVIEKMNASELNSLVELLASNSNERTELPSPMRLDDLLDVLDDVWDSSDL